MSKPQEYTQGWVEFYKLKFALTQDVLIPRPETELLVDEVLNFLKSSASTQTILDLGTGAGAIAISLAVAIAKNLPKDIDCKIVATEISATALEIAKKNAQLHGVADKIEFIESDLLDSFCHSERSEESLADASSNKSRDPSLIAQDDNLIIVTNLPYIPSERIAYLDSSVKDHEPHIALDGGQDGFELYRRLFQQMVVKKWQPKLFVGEIDYTHGEIALNEAQQYFPKHQVEVKLDLHHRQRILLIRQGD